MSGFFLRLASGLVVPGQPPFGLALDVLGMTLQDYQVAEDIDPGLVGGGHSACLRGLLARGARANASSYYAKSWLLNFHRTPINL